MKRQVRLFGWCLSAAGILTLAALSACGGDSDDAPMAVAPLACDDSMKTAFKPDANTSVLLAKQYRKGDAITLATPAAGTPIAADDVCLVKLLVGPGNTGPANAPSTSAGIGIEVWLPAPSKWNKRVHAVGGAGFAGDLSPTGGFASTSSIGSFQDSMAPWDVATREGAVSAQTDTGHHDATGAWAMNPDGTINQTLWEDNAERSLHELAVKTKALAAAFFGQAPKYSYYDGFSTGGRQALKLAQKYPQDFNGILSGSPAINWSKFITAELYPQIVNQRDLAGAGLTFAQQLLVSMAATSACDMVGGQHLGYLVDPASCKYDPTKDASILCTASGGTNSGASCVSPVQATAVNKYWYGMTVDGSVPDPALDNGWSVTLQSPQRWYGLARGTLLAGLASPNAFPIASTQVALELQDPTIADPSFLNGTGNGQSLWKNLSYAQLANAFDRGVALQSSFGNINTDQPDLSAFRDGGGKLVHYHGMADIVIFPQGSVNYYNRVAATMGGIASIQDFYRLYLVPAMGHTGGSTVNGETRIGSGVADPTVNPPAPTIEQLYAQLTNWVENGVAPDRIDAKSMVTSTANAVTSIPICVYPKKATFTGGDPFAATSYVCS